MATLEQYKKFIANEPESQREVRTIEVWHPQFGTVYRFVNDYSNFVGTLESTAPRNPGASVTFTAATLQIEDPAERNDSDQLLSITVGATDGQLHAIIDQISGSGYLSQCEIIYRKYYSGDTSAPAVPPLYLFMSGVNFDNGDSATITAEDSDLSSKRSGILYTLEFFPGLAQ